MIQMRFFGRGGQGAVTGVTLLGESIKNKEVLLYPIFGVERRGAPVQVFLYVDDKKITKREAVKISDFDVFFDESLLGVFYKSKEMGLKKKGIVLMNTQKSPEEIASKYKFLKGHKIAVVSATHIALKNEVVTGTGAAVNTAMLGAVSRVTSLVSLDDLKESMVKAFGPNSGKNMKAAKEAYEKTKFGYGV